MGKRTIRIDILKALLARSGNQCAFPNCSHPIFNGANLFIGQLCHIEAVSTGGPRYNSLQTQEERNGYDNLIFMCYGHHKESDDVKVYSVATLKDIKARHEKIFEQRPFEVNKDMVSQVKAEMKQYWTEVQDINRMEATELRMEIDINASFTEIADEINSLVTSLEESLDDVRKRDSELFSKTIEFLKGLGYHTKDIEAISYRHEVPFEQKNWEMHYLGWPNMINKIKLRLKQIEIKYYEEWLSLNPDDKKVRQRLEGVKGEFKYMSQTFGYFD